MCHNRIVQKKIAYVMFESQIFLFRKHVALWANDKDKVQLTGDNLPSPATDTKS